MLVQDSTSLSYKVLFVDDFCEYRPNSTLHIIDNSTVKTKPTHHCLHVYFTIHVSKIVPVMNIEP